MKKINWKIAIGILLVAVIYLTFFSDVGREASLFKQYSKSETTMINALSQRELPTYYITNPDGKVNTASTPLIIKPNTKYNLKVQMKASSSNAYGQVHWLSLAKPAFGTGANILTAEFDKSFISSTKFSNNAPTPISFSYSSKTFDGSSSAYTDISYKGLPITQPLTIQTTSFTSTTCAKTSSFCPVVMKPNIATKLVNLHLYNARPQTNSKKIVIGPYSGDVYLPGMTLPVYIKYS